MPTFDVNNEIALFLVVVVVAWRKGLQSGNGQMGIWD
jgi:hypothetical protein